MQNTDWWKIKECVLEQIWKVDYKSLIFILWEKLSVSNIKSVMMDVERWMFLCQAGHVLVKGDVLAKFHPSAMKFGQCETFLYFTSHSFSVPAWSCCFSPITITQCQNYLSFKRKKNNHIGFQKMTYTAAWKCFYGLYSKLFIIQNRMIPEVTD